MSVREINCRLREQILLDLIVPCFVVAANSVFPFQVYMQYIDRV